MCLRKCNNDNNYNNDGQRELKGESKGRFQGCFRGSQTVSGGYQENLGRFKGGSRGLRGASKGLRGLSREYQRISGAFHKVPNEFLRGLMGRFKGSHRVPEGFRMSHVVYKALQGFQGYFLGSQENYKKKLS